MSLSRPFGEKFEGRVSQWGNQSLKASSSSLWDTQCFFCYEPFFPSLLFEPLPWFQRAVESSATPDSVPFSEHTRTGPGVHLSLPMVFLKETAAGNPEARGQQERKDAHQLSQPGPAFSPLISQLLNISAGGCHSLPVWLRRWVKLQVSRDKGCHCVSDFSG